MVRVLFVCLGNICRSPLAEGVFRRLVVERGLDDAIEIDSAGTGGWHVGDNPDSRMQQTAQRHGVSLAGIRSRKVHSSDLTSFDYILAMDRQNLMDLQSFAGSGANDRVRLFRDYDPSDDGRDVPDPYYGGADGFETVFAIVDRGCRVLLDQICQEHGLRGKTSSQ